jgi:hypothetical protein
MVHPDFLLSLALGLGLATAVGFRVFLPLLVLGLGVRGGWVTPGSGFEWVGTDSALIMFAVAAVLEIAAYFVPLLDNALDAIAAPVAVMAGIGVTALALGDAPPMLKWTLAIIAGGGAAAATHGATAALRGLSTATTAGLGNHTIALGEIIAALGLALLSLVWPLVALAVVAAVIIAVLRRRTAKV